MVAVGDHPLPKATHGEMNNRSVETEETSAAGTVDYSVADFVGLQRPLSCRLCLRCSVLKRRNTRAELTQLQLRASFRPSRLTKPFSDSFSVVVIAFLGERFKVNPVTVFGLTQLPFHHDVR
jgi:hypothetical protein